jgi:alkanesulfonate monooxygenase SsuD/methylene tetrahydromethanopterin reductase-like flavin-dependent oxidoreductase (luciferase family)
VRESDYELTGRAFDARGALFDELLRGLNTAWAGEALTEDSRPPSPRPIQQPGVPLLIGGMTDAAIRRVVEFGDGWTAGGVPPDDVKAFADRVRGAWRDAERDGEPRIVALAYFGLGGTVERSRSYLLDYYAPMGSDIGEMVARSALRSPEAVAGAVNAFADAGVDELILDPTVGDLGQVDQLAEAAL